MSLINEKKNRSIEFTVKNEIKLDPSTPIPIQYGGDSFYIIRGKKYIPFLGRPDNLPNLLLEARLTSPTQNACITSIAQSTIGDGLVAKDVETPNPEFIEWAGCVNNEMQSLDEVFQNVIDGERTHGNQFIEIARGSLGKSKFLKVYTHPMSDCRLGSPDENTGYPTEVIISQLFAKNGYQGNLNTATVLPLWNSKALDPNSCWKKMADGTERTMLHFKNEVSGIKYYGLPASISGLRHQVLEGKSVQYNIDNFDNNMVLGGMLILKSSMTEEEAQETAKKIMMSHIGDGKTGRIAVISSESGLDDVDWKPYTTEKEGSFIELDKRIEEKIIAANGWDAILAGIAQKGGLGNGSSYVRSIWDVKESVLLNPLRKKLKSKVVLPIVQIYADWFGAKEIIKYKWAFQSAMPFSFLGDVDPETFMKVNEARGLASLPADDTVKDKYLSEMKSKQASGNPVDPATQNVKGN
jgi:capsid portal protein